ncbi:Galactinol--sucrose galactosyltransferase [Spatholobus suberectus]|nr:Galactinol--sucrose galactosyltransferase [Spatholobus suberectus]
MGAWGAFVRDLKDEFSALEYVYVWHAFCGYWGGVRPDVPGMPDSTVVATKLSPGAEMTMTDLAVVKIMEVGWGWWRRKRRTSCTRVFTRTLNPRELTVLEMLSEEYGGRVELAKAYYKALTASVRKHFKGNGVISSMQQCNDFMFLGTETISLGRVNIHSLTVSCDTFMQVMIFGARTPLEIQMVPIGCKDVTWCTVLTTACGYEISYTDWDMFQSDHACAEFHAASRAISGGPIYVSDSVGNHNFQLLKKLVLPDGSILRCQQYALPTRDCLFVDTLHDGKTMLKIWNLNKCSGDLGLFNCQGGGWCPVTRRNKNASDFSHSVTCFASPQDIEWSKGKHPICIKGVDVFAVYMFKDDKLKLLKYTESVEVSLEPFSIELLTVSPVVVLPRKSIQFAPIGFVNMLNSGGSILSIEFDKQENLG